MEGLVMRKVRVRLCLIVCGGDGGVGGSKDCMVGAEAVVCGVIIAGNLCVCECVCV